MMRFLLYIPVLEEDYSRKKDLWCLICQLQLLPALWHDYYPWIIIILPL